MGRQPLDIHRLCLLSFLRCSAHFSALATQTAAPHSSLTTTPSTHVLRTPARHPPAAHEPLCFTLSILRFQHRSPPSRSFAQPLASPHPPRHVTIHNSIDTNLHNVPHYFLTPTLCPHPLNRLRKVRLSPAAPSHHAAARPSFGRSPHSRSSRPASSLLPPLYQASFQIPRSRPPAHSPVDLQSRNLPGATQPRSLQVPRAPPTSPRPLRPIPSLCPRHRAPDPSAPIHTLSPVDLRVQFLDKARSPSALLQRTQTLLSPHLAPSQAR